MQTYISLNQDLSSTKLGVRRQMPQASLPSLNVAVSAPAYTPLTPTTPGTGIMPATTRETLAERLRKNWEAKYPADPLPQVTPAPTDDSLTSLSWLHNLSVSKMTSPTPPASPQPATDPTTNTNPTLHVNPNAVLNMDYGNTSAPVIRVKQEPGLATSNVVSPPRVNSFPHDMIPSPGTASPGLDKIDYKNDPRVKPPYSYAHLICMAMKETKKNKITLAGIYSWITENFMYYKVSDQSWQNSIRHNLSLNKSFMKVPRKKEEPGKGGFWKINPEYENEMLNGIYKKRRGSAALRDAPLSMTSHSSLKRQRSIDASDSDSNNVPDAPPTKVQKVKTEPLTCVPCLDGDFTWNSILSQDITVGDQQLKAEDIVDGDKDIASPITAMSPPPSEGSNKDEEFFEDFLNNPIDPIEPIDFTSGQPLDLSITGTNISKPSWWDESFSGCFQGEENRPTDSGLHTPVQSPDTHPWAEDKNDLDIALASFDCLDDTFFTVDNLTSQDDSS